MVSKEIWPLALESLQVLGKQYAPAMEAAANQAGLKTPLWYLLLSTLAMEPEPVTVDRLRVRAPYVSPHLYEKRLEKLIEERCLTAVREKEFYLTEKGRNLAQRIILSAYSEMDVLEPLPPADLNGLSGILSKLVKSCLAVPEPPARSSLLLSRRIDPGETAPTMVKIDQYLTDLNAYRDDSHLSAWQPHAISGSAWEAFTLIWRNEANTLDELYQKLERREYSRNDYARALQDLLGRGWIQEQAGRYLPTPSGRQIRQEAEELTDRYFFTPWDCLDEEEYQILKNLLVRFRNHFS